MIANVVQRHWTEVSGPMETARKLDYGVQSDSCHQHLVLDLEYAR